MYFSQNTEFEVKLIGDKDALHSAEKWLISRSAHGSGFKECLRNHVYFDTCGRILLNNGWSLRRALKSNKYLLKYPVEKVWAGLISRREVATGIGSESLNVMDPFHRALKILAIIDSRLGPEIEREGGWQQFSTVVSLEIHRRYRRFYHPNGSDVMFIAVLDSVAAKDAISGDRVRWDELELEVNGWFPECGALIEDYAQELVGRFGLASTFSSKYELAVSKLSGASRFAKAGYDA